MPHICKRLHDIIRRTVNSQRRLLAGDLVIPMPLHRSREKERGFNQALIIAKAVKELAGGKLDSSSLKRPKRTERHRAGMDSRDRARSVEGAFTVPKPSAISSARVLLVDDVYTTGSTACAAAEALIKAGAERVSLFTVARVI
jgi:ComF family protein